MEFEVMITPSVAQYEQLVDDLGILRAAGADSNTAAIIEAVHAAALASRRLTPVPRSAAA